MKYWLISLLSLVFATSALAKDLVTGKDIPQVLGVWYGEYQPTKGALPHEMWMEISYQKHINGFVLRGNNRWNIAQSDEAKHGAATKGKDAEHFDTFSGHIHKDLKTLSLSEDHRRSTIVATLTDANTLDATFTPHSSSQPPFHITLHRIDTHYSPQDKFLLGIDVSHHSGSVDWHAVKEHGYQFAYVKSSEGMDNPDAMFESHWKALQKLNFPRGAYHFYVTEDDPVKQATFFASRLKDDPGTLPPVIDVELLGHHTKGDMTKTLLAFLKSLEQQTGTVPMIYTTPTFWNRHYRPEFSRYPLWLSEFGVIMPKVPFGWKNWTFWQHQADRKVPGVEKTADINLLHPNLTLDAVKSATPKPSDAKNN